MIYRYLNYKDNDLQISELSRQWSTDIWTMTMIYRYLNYKDKDLQISEPWQWFTDIWTMTMIYRYLNHDNDLHISEPWQWTTYIWTMTMIYRYLNHDNDLQISEPWQWFTDIWTIKTMIYRYMMKSADLLFVNTDDMLLSISVVLTPMFVTWQNDRILQLSPMANFFLFFNDFFFKIHL
jgi:hypothetical protein